MPVKGMRMGITTMLRSGLEVVEVGMLVKGNAQWEPNPDRPKTQQRILPDFG